MKRFRSYQIEPLEAARSYPWRLIVSVDEAQGKTFFDLHWGDKVEATHTFVASAEEWKEITRNENSAVEIARRLSK